MKCKIRNETSQIFLSIFCLLLCISFVSSAQAITYRTLLHVDLDADIEKDSIMNCEGKPISYFSEEINIIHKYCEGNFTIYDETADEEVFADNFGDVSIASGQYVETIDDLVKQHVYTFTVTIDDYDENHEQYVDVDADVIIWYDPNDAAGMCP